MKQEEINFKTLLDYHTRLVKIGKTYRDAGNQQPGQKDKSAKDAGTEFDYEVGEFERQYGDSLRKKASQEENP
jgi:hypothetical protein